MHGSTETLSIIWARQSRQQRFTPENISPARGNPLLSAVRVTMRGFFNPAAVSSLRGPGSLDAAPVGHHWGKTILKVFKTIAEK